MSECGRIREMSVERDPLDDARFRRHALRCPDCRGQLEADRELRRLFQEFARPGPSLYFNRVLRQRLREEREGLRQRRWRLLVMQAYWMAAGVACAVILTLVRWPSGPPSAPVACVFGTMVVMTLLAPVVLFLTLRIGPLSLIARTMQAFRR